VSILTLQGIEAESAARVFPLSALTRVLTMPLVGRMFDRFHTRFVFVAGLLVVAGAVG